MQFPRSLYLSLTPSHITSRDWCAAPFVELLVLCIDYDDDKINVVTRIPTRYTMSTNVSSCTAAAQSFYISLYSCLVSIFNISLITSKMYKSDSLLLNRVCSFNCSTCVELLTTTKQNYNQATPSEAHKRANKHSQTSAFSHLTIFNVARTRMGFGFGR